MTNDRMQILAKAAGHDDIVDAYMQSLGFNMKLFAELIISECVEQCKQVAKESDMKSESKFLTETGKMVYAGMWGGANDCSTKIKSHFGFE